MPSKKSRFSSMTNHMNLKSKIQEYRFQKVLCFQNPPSGCCPVVYEIEFKIQFSTVSEGRVVESTSFQLFGL